MHTCPKWSTISIALTCSSANFLFHFSIHEFEKLIFTIHAMNERERCFMHVRLATGQILHAAASRSRSSIWCCVENDEEHEKANKKTNKLTRRFLASFHYAKHTTPRSCPAEVLSRLPISKRICLLLLSFVLLDGVLIFKVKELVYLSARCLFLHSPKHSCRRRRLKKWLWWIKWYWFTKFMFGAGRASKYKVKALLIAYANLKSERTTLKWCCFEWGKPIRSINLRLNWKLSALAY